MRSPQLKGRHDLKKSDGNNADEANASSESLRFKSAILTFANEEVEEEVSTEFVNWKIADPLPEHR